jgi:putative oxidoreductase
MAEDFGRLALRLGVGGMMLFHGIHKLMIGLGAVKAQLGSHGLPEAIAYIVYFGEIVGPFLVLIGLFARFGAFLIAVDVLAMVVLGGVAGVLAVLPSGAYALETQALYLAGALAVLLLGPGKFSITQGKHH